MIMSTAMASDRDRSAPSRRHGIARPTPGARARWRCFPEEMAQPAATTKRKHNRSASDAILGAASCSLIGALIQSEVRHPAAPVAIDVSTATNGSAAPLHQELQPPVAVDFDVDVNFGDEAPAARHSPDAVAANRNCVVLAGRHGQPASGGDENVENDHAAAAAAAADDDDNDDDDDDAHARDDEFDNDDNRPPSERDDASSDEDLAGGASLPQPHQQPASSQDPAPAVFQLDGAMFATQPPVLTKDSHAFRARFGTFLSGLSAPLLGFFKRITLLMSFLLVMVFTGYGLSYAVIDRIFSALAKVLAILHLPFPTSFKQFVRITSLDQFLQSTRELIMCPKCKALFNEADCSAPHPSGRGCAPARCPVMLWGKRCDAELVTMTKVNGVYVCSAAMSQKFTHLGIVNQLRQALSRPEICAHLFDHLKWTRREGLVRDLFDSACWQRWKQTPLPNDPTNYWFSPGFYHVALKAMCDAFQPFENSNYSLTAFIFGIESLPAVFRGREDAQLLVALAAGPHETSINHFHRTLQFFVDELKMLMHGVWMRVYTPHGLEERLVRAVLIKSIFDLPAAARFFSDIAHSSCDHSCSKCHFQMSDPDSWLGPHRLRTADEHKRNGDLWIKANSAARAKEIVSQTGLRYTPIFQIGFEPQRNNCIDAMHAVYLGMCKTMLMWLSGQNSVRAPKKIVVAAAAPHSTLPVATATATGTAATLPMPPHAFGSSLNDASFGMDDIDAGGDLDDGGDEMHGELNADARNAHHASKRLRRSAAMISGNAFSYYDDDYEFDDDADTEASDIDVHASTARSSSSARRSSVRASGDGVSIAASSAAAATSSSSSSSSSAPVHIAHRSAVASSKTKTAASTASVAAPAAAVDNTFAWCVFTDGVFKLMQTRMNNLRIDRYHAGRMPSIEHKFSGMKAAEFKCLFAIALPHLLLSDVLAKVRRPKPVQPGTKKQLTEQTDNSHRQTHTQLLTLLVHVCRLLPTRSCSVFLFDVEHEIFLLFNRTFLAVAPDNGTQNQHLAEHMRADQLENGPSSSNTLFAMEQRLGVLGKTPQNYKNITRTLAERWILRQSLRHPENVTVADTSQPLDHSKPGVSFGSIVRDTGVPLEWFSGVLNDDGGISASADNQDVCSLDITGHDELDECYFSPLRTHHPLHADSLKYLRLVTRNTDLLAPPTPSSTSSSSSSSVTVDFSHEFGTVLYHGHMRVPLLFHTGAEFAPRPPRDGEVGPLLSNLQTASPAAWAAAKMDKIASDWTPQQLIAAIRTRLALPIFRRHEHFGFSPRLEQTVVYSIVESTVAFHLRKRVALRPNDKRTEVRSMLWTNDWRRSCVLVCCPSRDSDLHYYASSNLPQRHERVADFGTMSYLHACTVLAIVEMECDVILAAFQESHPSDFHITYAVNVDASGFKRARAFFCLVDFFTPHQHLFNNTTYSWPWDTIAQPWDNRAAPMQSTKSADLRRRVAGAPAPSEAVVARERALRLVPLARIAALAAVSEVDAANALATQLNRSFNSTNVTPIIVSPLPLH